MSTNMITYVHEIWACPHFFSVNQAARGNALRAAGHGTSSFVTCEGEVTRGTTLESGFLRKQT